MEDKQKGLVMDYASLDDFVVNGKQHVAKGPIAIIMIEDLVEVASTLKHHIKLGFKKVLVLGKDLPDLSPAISENVTIIQHDFLKNGTKETIVNKISQMAPAQWIYYCFNAEYLFFPFCETRNVDEMLAFHTEEKRNSMLCYVIDLYAGDLGHAPNAVSIEDAHIDKAGYYSLGRTDPKTHALLDRQLDFFGGLRWRYEEFVPYEKRKIDRIALFKAKEGLALNDLDMFNEAEYNTYACPWHHNLTAAIVSFRTAKSLRRNPTSRHQISDFKWHNSTKFSWHSQQLLDLGLMEPGQWF